MTKLAINNCGHSAFQAIRQGVSTRLVNVNMGLYLSDCKHEKSMEPYYRSELLKILEKWLNIYYRSNDMMVFIGNRYNRVRFGQLLEESIEGYSTAELMHIIHLYKLIKFPTVKRVFGLISSYM